jgi:hypothetical protein
MLLDGCFCIGSQYTRSIAEGDGGVDVVSDALVWVKPDPGGYHRRESEALHDDAEHIHRRKIKAASSALDVYSIGLPRGATDDQWCVLTGRLTPYED